VKRLDGYELKHAELFGRVAAFIEKKMMPIVLRHAISGTALREQPRTRSSKIPSRSAMLIDIFSERGYHAVVDLHRIEVPEHFDLKTGQTPNAGEESFPYPGAVPGLRDSTRLIRVAQRRPSRGPPVGPPASFRNAGPRSDRVMRLSRRGRSRSRRRSRSTRLDR